MDRVRIATAALVAAGALLLASCGTEAAPGTSGDASVPAPGAAASTAQSPNGIDVSSLVGTWSVTGAAVAAGQTVTVSPFELRVWVPCGHVSGSWRATTTGLFAGDVYSWSGGCSPGLRFPWLDTAAGWRPDGSSFRLVDAQGQDVAVWAPAPAPTDEAYAGIPVPDQASLSDEDRRIMNTSPTMGAGIETVATRELLVGSWSAVPPQSAPPDGGPGAEWPEASLTLDEDGTWSGTDGCNGGRGRWNADDGGSIIATSGPQTLVGCNNIDAPRWLGSAFLAGFTDDGALVLLDHQGAELGRLTRS